MSIKVLLDTDIGSDIDDAVCLAYLLAQPECELLGITTVSGEVEKRAQIASALCRTAGRQVPIFPGTADPLLVPQKQPQAPQAAALKGSQNLAGISDPVIDALIERIIAADSRASLTTACKALDRVIRAGRYWIPHWYAASHRIAYWDVFGRPATKPRYARGIPETWWYDRDKAATIEQRG